MSPSTDSGRWSRPEAALAGTDGPEGRGLFLRRLHPDRVGPDRSGEKGMSRRFLADTRGAVGIAAALLTTMFLGGMALVIDHLWLVGKRDMLKDATDAATLAATLELSKLSSEMSDADAETALKPVAERYVRLNLLNNLPSAARTAASDSLVVSVDLDRSAGLVDVTAEAALGETLLSKLLFGYAGSGDDMKETSRVEATMIATEVALAIDVTGSMNDNLQGQVTTVESERKLKIVRDAALKLVDILEEQAGDTTPLALGIVPWSYHVRLDAATRTRWEEKGWAVYPSEQYYRHPPAKRPGSTEGTWIPGPDGPGEDDYLPTRQALPSDTEIAKSCRAWRGCLDPRTTKFTESGDDAVPPAFSDDPPPFPDDLPGTEPFPMSFFTGWTGENNSGYAGVLAHYPQYLSYQCHSYELKDGYDWEAPVCYDLDRATQYSDGPAHCEAHLVGGTKTVRRKPPQFDCYSDEPEILPLTSKLETVRARLNGLTAPKWTTYSAIGVSWGARLLDPAWRDAWGKDAVHPMDSTTARPVQKVLVLLTDGEDTPYYKNNAAHRADACDKAKAAGFRVFVVAAMRPEYIGTVLSGDLEACSSAGDYPGRHVFLNNATADNLEDAFQEIGEQLLVMRRVH